MSNMKLMYITNRPEIAKIVEAAGVDRIFVDMEYIGKSARQGGMDTVQSHHTVEDIRCMKAALEKAQVMVRINPIHDRMENEMSSAEEIDAAIAAGADILMLPYFKTMEELETFIRLVDGRVRTLPLIETPEAAELIDQIVELPGIDELYIGLNDLSLGYGKSFMFEMLADGTVEKLSNAIRAKGIPFGFGGIAAPGTGMLPAEHIVMEHYRMGSTCVILSRSFCDLRTVTDLADVQRIFEKGVGDVRALEAECSSHQITDPFYTENKARVAEEVAAISEIIAKRKAQNA